MKCYVATGYAYRQDYRSGVDCNTRVVIFQQGQRDRVQRDDATGCGQRGAGRSPDTQTLAEHRDRVGV